jgi:NlpC/P60 family
VFVEHPSTNTKRPASELRLRASAKPLSGTPPSLMHPRSVFWAKTQLPQEPRKGGLAYRDTPHLLEVAVPVLEGESGSLFHVGLEGLPGILVELGFLAGMFLRGKRPTFSADGGVTFYGGAAYPEGLCGLALWHPCVYGLEDHGLVGGKAVRSYADLRGGDLVYFAYDGGTGYIHHVGMYVDHGRMIHSPNPSRGVEIISIERSGLIKEYAGAISYY